MIGCKSQLFQLPYSLYSSDVTLRRKTTLKSSAAEAAVLMMPEAVQLSVLQNIAPFREYIRTNLKSWYKFVQLDLGREINNGEIRVVYGCRKSAAFGIATVSHTGRQNASTELTFSIDSSWIEITGCKYRWHYGGFAEVKAGPSLKEIRDILDQRGARTYDTIINQCLFVSTIDMPLPEAEWKSIKPVSITQVRSSSQSASSASPHLTACPGGTTPGSVTSNVHQQGQMTNTGPQDTPMPVVRDEIGLWPPLPPSEVCHR